MCGDPIGSLRLYTRSLCASGACPDLGAACWICLRATSLLRDRVLRTLWPLRSQCCRGRAHMSAWPDSHWQTDLPPVHWPDCLGTQRMSVETITRRSLCATIVCSSSCREARGVVCNVHNACVRRPHIAFRAAFRTHPLSLMPPLCRLLRAVVSRICCRSEQAMA